MLMLIKNFALILILKSFSVKASIDGCKEKEKCKWCHMTKFVKVAGRTWWWPECWSWVLFGIIDQRKFEDLDQYRWSSGSEISYVIAAGQRP